MSQIILNELNVGTYASKREAEVLIAYLQGRGYSVVYGAYDPQAAQSIKPKHWNAAQRAACKAVAEQPATRDFDTLTLAQQAAALAEINSFLAELLCKKLADAMPAPVEDQFLAEALAQAEELLS